MCSSSNNTSTLMPFGMKLNGGQFSYYTTGSQHLSMEIHRAQLQDYAQRLQLGLRSFPGQVAGVNPLAYHGHVMHPYLHPYFCKDPRARFVHEEPKPNHSYIGLIAMAILSSRDKKLVLSDIYQWILDNYSYFRTRGPGWRNSIRHNLSLNDCFIKAGRSANGKGHYWAIHPANMDDFQKGDFRRRRAQRRVRKHMGLSVPDDDDDDSPLPSPAPQQTEWVKSQQDGGNMDATEQTLDEGVRAHPNANSLLGLNNNNQDVVQQIRRAATNRGFRRQFDVESLLAPEPDYYKKMREEINNVNFAEPADIFAIDKQKNGEPKRDEHNFVESEANDTSKNDNDDSGVSDGSSPSTSRDFRQSGPEYDNEKEFYKNECNGCQESNDDYDENELNDTDSSNCVISVDTDNNNGSASDEDKNVDVVIERKCNSVQNVDDNQRDSSSENEDDRPTQHIGNAPYGYIQLNNYSNANDIGSLYSANKQSYISQFGKLVRFPFHPQHTILTGLGSQLDMEAAHRWQQSMASLLMKAQVNE